MAMTISGSTGVVYPDGSSQASGQQACKAWVNFNGRDTIAIRAAYNITSITDNGTGSYTVNFTIPMVDTSYVITSISNGDNDFTTVGLGRDVYAITSTTSCPIRTFRVSDNAAVDNILVSASFFR